MWGVNGFKGIWEYKKGYLVKIRVSFIENMYWEGGSTKELLEVFINI
jgi:hypothetical protein